METPESAQLIETLPDGLTLRQATAADREPLAAFHAGMHADDDGAPDANILSWVRELLSGNHPTFVPSDFTVIESPEGQIVSSLCLISQTWTYGGIPIKAGRIELVSTHPDFRRRGLVRVQMDLAHRWSAERGELIQGITGIPQFYRQFGYEMALSLGGGHSLPAHRVPKLADGESEPFCLRTATPDDAPFIAALEEVGRKRWLISAVRTAEHWRYELAPKDDPKFAISGAIIETAAGESVGYLAHYGDLYDGILATIDCELAAGLSWLAVVPSLLRGLVERADALAGQFESGPVRDLYFGLGGDHPLYQVLPQRYARVSPAYAWFVRIPDVSAFLQAVAPVLEKRLAESVACGHSGELLLNFYTERLAARVRVRATGGRRGVVATGFK